MIEQDVTARVDPGLIELQRAALETGHPLRVILHGMSMFPFIRSGDAVVIEVAPWSDLRRGDVIYYERDCRLIAHRVLVAPIDVSAPAVTKGDTLLTLDPPVLPAQLIGRVTAVERNGRAHSLRRGPGRLAQRLAAEISFPWSRAFWRVAAVRRRIVRSLILVPALRSRRRLSAPPASIRPYRDSDLDMLANCLWDLRPRLGFAVLREGLGVEIQDRTACGETLLVAEDGRRIVGAGLVSKALPDSSRGIDLYVHPLARGCGTGERLLDALVMAAKGAGAVRLEFTIPASSRAARSLLRKRGARPSDGSLPSGPSGADAFVFRSLFESEMRASRRGEFETRPCSLTLDAAEAPVLPSEPTVPG